MADASALLSQLDFKAHAAESSLHALFAEAGADGQAIQEARALGLSWPALLALMIQYGPTFLSVLKTLIAALKSRTPGGVGSSPTV